MVSTPPHCPDCAEVHKLQAPEVLSADLTTSPAQTGAAAVPHSTEVPQMRGQPCITSCSSCWLDPYLDPEGAVGAIGQPVVPEGPAQRVDALALAQDGGEQRGAGLRKIPAKHRIHAHT